MVNPDYMSAVKSEADLYLANHKNIPGLVWAMETLNCQQQWVGRSSSGYIIKTCRIDEFEIDGSHPDELEFKKEIESLKAEIYILTRENNELKYLPGGRGYAEALADWNLRNNIILEENISSR